MNKRNVQKIYKTKYYLVITCVTRPQLFKNAYPEDWLNRTLEEPMQSNVYMKKLPKSTDL